MTAVAGGVDLTSLLLPGTADAGLDGLANSTLIDDEMPVLVSPVDQLLVALTRRLMHEPPTGSVAVVQLPRAQHRIAVTLAICVHLLRLREDLVAGPVVLTALDVDMTAQLRRLKITNYSCVSLRRDNPLSAQRLTRTGELAPLIGSVRAATDTSLVYYSTRVGTPQLRCSPPLVVLDATSIINPDSRARTLQWASEHSAALTIVIGDIGDDVLVENVAAAGIAPLVLPVTGADVAALVYNCGRQEPSPSPLSSMWILWRDGFAAVTVHRAGDAEMNDVISRGFACMATRPDGPIPAALQYPAKLLNSGTRLAATVGDYRRACALASRPGEGPTGIRNLLKRLDFREPSGAWRAWGVARWGELKVAVETLWRHLDTENPKLGVLWELLERADREAVGQILIRCHSQAAAAATRSSLSGEGRTDAQLALWARIGARVEVTTFAARYPQGHAAVQILTGNPPPWRFSVLFGSEASATWLIAYDAEQALLRRQLARWQDRATAWRNAAFGALGAAAPAPVTAPIIVGETDCAIHDPAELRLPGFSIADVLDRVSEVIDSAPIPGASSPSWQGNGACSCVPVSLADGRTWWVHNEQDRDGDLATPVLMHTVSGERFVRLRDVRAGDVIVVPAGDGTESVHARLIALSHTNDSVAAFDAILGQFRRAARKVLYDSGSQRAAVEAVRRAGADAAPQLTLWASGETIAPRAPGDIAAVFRAAHESIPDLGLLNSVARRLRTLHRDLGGFVTALASGRGDAAVARLRCLIGDSANELLDEFVAVEVAAVGRPTNVPTNLAGRMR
ncbi:hypothetical protein ABQE45_16100 [Mycobacteroides chelonae]